MRVFISWSGEASGKVANLLAESFRFVIDNLQPWVSKQNIDAGARWWDEVVEGLKDSEFGIVCVTPENLSSPWLMAEIGALVLQYRSKGGVCPYLLGIRAEDLRLTPLDGLQAKTADKEGTRELLQTLTELAGGPQRWPMHERRFDLQWPRIEEALREIQEDAGDFSIANAQRDVLQQLRRTSEIGALRRNRYMRQIVADEIRSLSRRVRGLRETRTKFCLPYIEYPYALARLMEMLKPTVKALAVVDQDEHFWRSTTAEEVLAHTPKECTRVFVFRDSGHMKENMAVLRQHAARYNVRVLAYNDLARQFPGFTDDYSIVGDIRHRVLARYDKSTKPKTISFTNDSDQISRFEDELNTIINASRIVSKEVEDNRLIEEVFSPPKLTPVERRQIEMSAYIKIHDYDRHEEEHAYYVEMMNRMIELCRSHHPSSGRMKILELGAGTGIFTKRLLDIEHVDIVAVEIDWACYKALEDRAHMLTAKADHNDSSLRAVNNDSRTFDSGENFDVIVSSFADHHIKFLDKSKYFANVRKNLKPGAIFLVGDEFLPEYERSNSEARRVALHAYHGHIIDIARRAGHAELMELETAALNSGLAEIGDFKLSCLEYEELLAGEGFVWIREKIGPCEHDDVGGVYVYRIRVTDADD